MKIYKAFMTVVQCAVLIPVSTLNGQKLTPIQKLQRCWSAKTPSGDPGEPDDFDYGVKDKDTGIRSVKSILLNSYQFIQLFNGIKK